MRFFTMRFHWIEKEEGTGMREIEIHHGSGSPGHRVGGNPLTGKGIDLATHLYVASQTFNVWQNFDPDFYSALISQDDSLRITTRKFYYIGDEGWASFRPSGNGHRARR